MNRMRNAINTFGLGKVALLAVLIGMLAIAGCSSSKQAISYRGAPKNVKEFEVDGLKVILRPNGGANHVVAAKLFVRGGLAALPEGMSPAVEQLALLVPPMSGPKDMAKPEYRRKIDRMVTGIIPATNRDYSSMTLRCVDEQFDESWDIFTSLILRPNYDPVELTNLKQRLAVSLKNRKSVPESYANYLADSAFFHGHPYGRIAQPEDIPMIDAAMLEKHYRKLFQKSRIFLVVVGNLDSADLHNKVAATLAKLPMGSYEDPEIPSPDNAESPRLIIRKPQGRDSIVTNYVIARYSAPDYNDPMRFPMMRLTSFLSGTLFREIRIERNLSYAPDADVSFANASYGQISVSTTLPDSAWRVAKKEAIDFFRDYIINEKYMQNGLSGWITSNYVREQTNDSQAEEMGIAELYTGSWTNAFRTFDEIRSLTAVEMNQAAQRHLKNFTVVIVGDPSSVTPSEYLPQEEATGSVNKESGTVDS